MSATAKLTETLHDVERRSAEGADLTAVREALELLDGGAQLLRPEDIFGPAQAAAYLGVNRTTVSRWKREGYMPAPFVDLGDAGTWTLWTRDALDAFKAERVHTVGDAGRRTAA